MKKKTFLKTFQHARVPLHIALKNVYNDGGNEVASKGGENITTIYSDIYLLSFFIETYIFIYFFRSILKFRFIIHRLPHHNSLRRLC